MLSHKNSANGECLVEDDRRFHYEALQYRSIVLEFGAVGDIHNHDFTSNILAHFFKNFNIDYSIFRCCVAGPEADRPDRLYIA